MIYGWLGWPPDVEFQKLDIGIIVTALYGVCQKYPHLGQIIAQKYKRPDRDFLNMMMKKEV